MLIALAGYAANRMLARQKLREAFVKELARERVDKIGEARSALYEESAPIDEEYTSIAYTERLGEIGAAPSIGTVGDSFDAINAMAESVIALFKTELHRNPDLEIATCAWVSWFNEERFRGELGDLTPAEVEDAYYRALGQASAA